MWAQGSIFINWLGRVFRVVGSFFFGLLQHLVRGVFRFFRPLRQSRLARVAFLLFLMLPPLIIFVLLVIMPLHHLPDWSVTSMTPPAAPNQSSTNVPLPENSAERQQMLQSLIALDAKAAFYKAQLELAKADSINFTIDLVDSVVNLQIRGLTVRQCKIQHFELSRVFSQLRSQHYLSDLLSWPFVLQKEWANIPKMPVRVIQAPKDTLEALQRADQEVRLEKPDVFFTFQFDRRLILEVEQTETPSRAGLIQKLAYRYQCFRQSVLEMFPSFLSFKPPQYQLWIRLHVSREDAKAIYRSLPQKALLAIQM